MTFSSIIGQTKAKARLVTALLGTPGHAYAFAGPDGIGKTFLARKFAQALLCRQSGKDGACGRCPSCRHFDHGVHPDYRELQIEPKEKNIKIDRVRQTVCRDVDLRPQFGDRKVYLLAADHLNEQGQNALLKTLEEPPEYCFFLLTIVGPERLLPTVLSRVNLVALQRYTPDEILAILDKNGIEAGEKAAFYSRFSGGLGGVALELASTQAFHDLRQETLAFFKHIGRRTRAELLTQGYRFFESNREATPMIFNILGSLIRDQLVFALSRDHSLITNQDQISLLKSGLVANTKPREAADRLTAAYGALLAARRGLTLNASYEGLVCNLLLNLRKELNYA